MIFFIEFILVFWGLLCAQPGLHVTRRASISCLRRTAAVRDAPASFPSGMMRRLFMGERLNVKMDGLVSTFVRTLNEGNQ
jgi:hypothetical protein